MIRAAIKTGLMENASDSGLAAWCVPDSPSPLFRGPEACVASRVRGAGIHRCGMDERS